MKNQQLDPFEITDEEEEAIAQSLKEIEEGKSIVIAADDNETLRKLLIID